MSKLQSYAKVSQDTKTGRHHPYAMVPRGPTYKMAEHGNKKKRNHIHKSVSARVTMDSVLKIATPLVARKNLLVSATSEKEWHFAKMDAKSAAAEISNIDTQLALLRQTMRSEIGVNHISIKLPMAYDNYMVATVTTGVVATVITVRPSLATEWTTLVALFDEYMMSGLDVFHNNLLLVNSISASSTFNTTTRITVADPADATALGSVAAGLQYTANEVLPLALNGNGVQAAMHFLPVNLPKASSVDNTGLIVAAQSTWLNTSPSGSTYIPVYCFLKHYTIQSVVTANTVESAAFIFKLQFRYRN